MLENKNFDNASIHEIAGNIMVPQLWEISLIFLGCFFGIFSNEGNILISTTEQDAICQNG